VFREFIQQLRYVGVTAQIPDQHIGIDQHRRVQWGGAHSRV
jgi:hypothetical protein